MNLISQDKIKVHTYVYKRNAIGPTLFNKRLNDNNSKNTKVAGGMTMDT